MSPKDGHYLAFGVEHEILDGHQHGVRIRGRVRSPLPHRRTFDLLRTHLLCDRPLSGCVGIDRGTILTALRAGAAWLTCPCVAPAHGARMWVEGDDGETVGLGAETRAGASVLRVRLPRSAELTLRRDGAPIHETRATSMGVRIGPVGAYRIEARSGGRLWLLSNPIHLR